MQPVREADRVVPAHQDDRILGTPGDYTVPRPVVGAARFAVYPPGGMSSHVRVVESERVGASGIGRVQELRVLLVGNFVLSNAILEISASTTAECIRP